MDAFYSVRALQRIHYRGMLARPGDVLRVQRLATALHFVRTGQARPADADTARDVEIGLLLQDAIPRPRACGR